MNLRAWILLAVIIVLASAAVVTLPDNAVPATPTPRDAPVVTWTIDGQPAHPFDSLADDAAVRLRVHWTAPLHCYVASWSAIDGTLALFPTPWLATDLENPIAAGMVSLPGCRSGRELAWPARAGVPGLTDYLVIASEQPLPELAAVFARLRQASNTTFPDGAMTITAPRDRKIADVPPVLPLPHELLRAAQALGAEAVNGAMTPARAGVWLAHWAAAPPLSPEPVPPVKK